MLTTMGAIASSQYVELLVWDSTLGDTNCNILNLIVYITGGGTITSPWSSGVLLKKGGPTTGEAMLDISTLNIKADSVVITSIPVGDTGQYIAIQYEDLSQVTLRSNISTTATEEYVINPQKKIRRIITSADDYAKAGISYIKFKGVTS